MGLVLSRLWATKKSFREHLEHIESEIRKTETAQQRNAIIQRQLISSIVLWSSIVYIASAIGYYLIAFPPTWSQRFFHAIPFILAPFIIYFINKTVNYVLQKRYVSYGKMLKELQEEKKKILDEVIETESFKNAKELLERFDPQSTFLRPSHLDSSVMTTPAVDRSSGRPTNYNTSTPMPGSEIRRRNMPPENEVTPVRGKPVAATSPQPRQDSPTSAKRAVKPLRRKPQGDIAPIIKTPPPKVMSSSGTQTSNDKIIPTGVANRSPQVQIVREYLLPGHVKNERACGPPQPMQILPQERTSMDKFVEFVIGDGPNNRYALICSQCHSHNGMALQEDYEYMTFRCAYCYTVNPARRNTSRQQQRQQYKLPNLQVKPPTIIKEIESGAPSPSDEKLENRRLESSESLVSDECDKMSFVDSENEVTAVEQLKPDKNDADTTTTTAQSTPDIGCKA